MRNPRGPSRPSAPQLLSPSAPQLLWAACLLSFVGLGASVVEVSPDMDWKTSVTSAVSGSVIQFAPGLYSGACGIEIGNSLTLQGSGDSAVTNLTCAEGTGVFTVKDADLEIRGLALTGKSSTDGGCLRVVGGQLTLSNSTLYKCVAAESGGGVFAENSTVQLLNSTLFGCQAEMRGGGLALVRSILKVEGSQFLSNWARLEHGGGVYAIYSTLSIIDRTLFSQNHALSHGGAIFTQTSTTTIARNVEISDNDAGFGAVSQVLNSSTSISQGVNFLRNSATGTGGAIYQEVFCSLDIYEDVVFQGNGASGTGGAISTFTSSSIDLDRVVLTQNSADEEGGAIHAESWCPINLREGVKFLENFAVDGGGGIHLRSGSSITAVGVDFIQNMAEEEGGAILCRTSDGIIILEGVKILENYAGDDGGGIGAEEKRPRIFISNSSLDYNIAMDNGGAMNAWNDMSDDHEDVLDSVWQGVLEVEIVNSSCCHNYALDYGGCASLRGLILQIHDSVNISHNRAERKYGAGVYLSTGSKAYIWNQVILNDNYADIGRGAALGLFAANLEIWGNVVMKNNFANRGGAVYCTRAAVMTINDTLIQHNSAELFGGAIAWWTDCTGSIQDSQILDNYADRGGGLYLYTGAKFDLLGDVAIERNQALFGGGICHASSSRVRALGNNLKIDNNRASFGGGGIYLAASVLQLNGGDISLSHNWGETGGAMYLLSADSVVEVLASTQISNNSATNGGGLYMAQNVRTVLNGSITLSGNAALEKGGAIRVDSATAVLTGITMSHNTAEIEGGAMSQQLGSSVVTETIVFGNTANNGGGFSINNGAVLEMSLSVFTANQALRDGGGFMCSGSSCGISSSTFQDNTAVKGGALTCQGGDMSLQSSVVDFNSAEVDGGGVSASQCALSITQQSRVQSNRCLNSGGGVFVSQGSLVFEDSVLRNNSATSGGGGAQTLDADLTVSNSQVLENWAHSKEGGGVDFQGPMDLKIVNSVFSRNMAALAGGAIRAAGGRQIIEGCQVNSNTGSSGGGVYSSGHTHFAMVRCNLTDNEANGMEEDQGDGGGISFQGAGTFESIRISDCRAVGFGGAISLSGEEEVKFSKNISFQRCTSGLHGGCLASFGSGMSFEVEEMRIQRCAAGGNGGAMHATGPVLFATGVSILEDNVASGRGGGISLSDSEAVLDTKQQLLVRRNNATKGGGLFLSDSSSIAFSEACPAECTQEMLSNQDCDFHCMRQECGWDGGSCNHLFFNAGPDASKSCDRSTCPLWKLQPSQECEASCLTASCDFGSLNPNCTQLMQSRLADCPVFDWIAVSSYAQEPWLRFAEQVGHAGVISRCNDTGCIPADSSTAGVCSLNDDSGKSVRQSCPDCPVEVVGEATGHCLPNSLFPEPSTGAPSVDPIDSIELMPIYELLDFHPGCGLKPLWVEQNIALGSGGGIALDTCLASIMSSLKNTLVVEFSDNQALLGAGGALYVDCEDSQRYSDLTMMKNGLPEPASFPSSSNVLHTVGNMAGMYGDAYANLVSVLLVQNNLGDHVPGLSLLDLDIRVTDAFDNVIRLSPDSESVASVRVCVPDNTSSACSSKQQIQPTMYFQIDPESIWSSTLLTAQALQYCVWNSDIVHLYIATALEIDSAINGELNGPPITTSVSKKIKMGCKPCPPGSALQTQTNIRGVEVWSCRKCNEEFQSGYVLDPSNPAHSCHRCPAGLICEEDEVVPRVEGSKFFADHQIGIYRLISCPKGFQVDNTTSDGNFDHDSQSCSPCLAGEECQEEACVRCSQCPSGKFKPTSGPDVCEKCPENSYDSGTFRSCNGCPLFSSTQGLDGRSSIDDCLCYDTHFPVHDNGLQCEGCYTGGLCPDQSCGFNYPNLTCPDGTVILGEWRVRQDGRRMLTSCPRGYLLVNNVQHSQHCSKCDSFSYSLNSLDGCDLTIDPPYCPPRSCVACPQGAVCRGGDHFSPTSPNSTWIQTFDSSGSSVLRVQSCSGGEILVRDDRYPALDRCLECPTGFYHTLRAEYGATLWTASADQATGLCLLCPSGSDCPGGNKVIPKFDFWKLPLTENPNQNSSLSTRRSEDDVEGQVKVYQCFKRSCLEGGVCVEGKEGPICAVCRPGHSPVGMRCLSCPDPLKTVTLTVICALCIPFVLAIWYFVSWKPFFYYGDTQEAPAIYEESSSAPTPLKKIQTALAVTVAKFKSLSVTEFAKVLISFFQVMSTFEITYVVEWPSELKVMWNWGGAGALWRLNILEIYGVHCLSQGVSYFDSLLIYTSIPIVVSVLLAIPTACAFFLDSGTGPRFEAVYLRLWQAGLFWIFLLYPLVSASSVQGLNCLEIGDENLLTADLRNPCPADRHQSPEFILTVMATILYPVGVPAGLLYLLFIFRIPQLAKYKRQDALLRHLIKKYCERTAREVAEQYDQISRTKSEEQSRSQMPYLMEAAIRSSSLRNRNSTGASQPESPQRPELQRSETYESELHDKLSEFAGTECVEDLSDEQIQHLCNFQWAELIKGSVQTKPISRLMTFSEQVQTALQNEEYRQFQCPLKREASRANKIRWLTHMGNRFCALGLIPEPKEEWDQRNERESLAVCRLGFLVRGYKTELWFWELVELSRKFIMTSLMVFLYPGSPQQVASGLVVTLMFLLSYLRYRPFRNDAVSSLMIVCLSAQLATLFYGLMKELMKLQAEVDQYAAGIQSMRIFVVVLNIAVFIVPVVYLFSGSTRDAALRQVMVMLRRWFGWLGCFGKEDIFYSRRASQIPSGEGSPRRSLPTLQQQDAKPTGTDDDSVMPEAILLDDEPQDPAAASLVVDEGVRAKVRHSDSLSQLFETESTLAQHTDRDKLGLVEIEAGQSSSSTSEPRELESNSEHREQESSSEHREQDWNSEGREPELEKPPDPAGSFLSTGFA